jgi:hypothetical protein
MENLAFIMAQRHPRNARDYGRVEAHMRTTLASICRQTDDSYQVVVVGNRAPSFRLPEKVTFVTVDYAVPFEGTTYAVDRRAFLRDKGSKLAVAMLACPALHYMTVDADDFVSRHIAGFVATRPGGWFVDRGYRFHDRRRLIRQQDDFSTVCGTSMLFPSDVIDIPRGMVDAASSQDDILAAYGEDVVVSLLGSHRSMRAYCEQIERPLAPLPFRAAVWRVSSGENASGRLPMGFGAPVAASVAEEFGISRSPRAWLGMGYQVAPIALGSARRATAGIGRRLREMRTL